jgi:photosystem II stability/assembly factor-like uncharacterized protein
LPIWPIVAAAFMALVAAADGGARDKVEPRYRCGSKRLTPAQIARRFRLPLETVEKIPTLGGLPYEAFCGLDPEKREVVLDRAEREIEEYDHPDEAIRFRLLSLKDENGRIPHGAEVKAFEATQAMRASALRRRQMSQSQSVVAEGAGVTPTSWTWLGPGNVGGRVRAAIINPGNPSEMLLGSVGGGLWRTTNGGASWTAVNDFMANLAVTSLAYTPGDWNVQYASTGEGFLNQDGIRGAGVFKSTNGGLTWSQLLSTNTADFYETNRVAVAGNTVLAATGTGTNRGIYRSTDAGNSFTLVRAGYGVDVKFDPGDPSRAVAALGGTAAYTIDGGATWTSATGLPTAHRVELAYARSAPSIVYASSDFANGLVYRSNDGGRTFVRQTSGTPGYLGPQGSYANALWVDPTDANRVIVGGMDLWRSADGGITLTKMSQWFNAPASAHADHHLILAHPGFNGGTNRIAYNFNDGGAYRIEDTNLAQDTSGFTELNNGLGITQYYGGAANYAGTVVGGTQDNGTLCLRFGDGSEQWKEEYSGDGGQTAIDPGDSRYIYGEYVYANVHRLTTGCGAGTASTILPQQTGANFIAPLTLDPNDPATLLVGAGQLLRCADIKATTPAFVPIKLGTGSAISAVHVAPGNSNHILVGHNNGDIYKTMDGAAASPTWTKIDGSLPNRYVTDLAVDPLDANVYYAAFGGYTSSNLYKSTDGGATWTSIHGGLPAMPVRTIAIHPLNPSWMYAGTELGVFTSEDAGATWNASTDGPANVSVEDLVFVGYNTLYAFTHGRGAYRATVTGATTPAEILSPPPGSFLPGASTTFTWSKGRGVSGYWLYVGTSVGAGDLYSASQGSATSTTVSGLPSDGRTLYVRLWSAIGTGWEFRDYTYRAYTPPVPAEMLTPAPGSALSASSATFTWSMGTAVSQYAIWIGSSLANNDLYLSGALTATSVTISSLPTDGRTLYLRLWSGSGDTWSFRDYTYRAFAQPTPAEMQTPSPGATLTGPSVTFGWSPGYAVSSYWIYIGSAPGGSDVYSASQGMQTWTTINGLPTDGRTLYLRLWSLVNGLWQFRDTTYHASH